jgi:sulfur-oxidizing protein SoxY
MQTRRQTLKQSAVVAGLLAATGLFPQYALAFNKAAFDAKNLADALKALGAGAPTESKDVTLTGPTSPKTAPWCRWRVASSLPGVKQLLMLVEKNPNAGGDVQRHAEVDANFPTRVKMGQSSDVLRRGHHERRQGAFAKKEVKVTLGGCGG